MTRTRLQTPTVYPAWNLALPRLPPRSRLYRLEPIGVGTPAVESLTGYITRLAAAHSVDTGTLFREELVPLFNRSYLLTPEGKPVPSALVFIKTIHALNGMSRGAAAWVSALETLTRFDHLRYLTLLAWKDVLTLRSLTRTKRAWCPDCFTEQREQRQPVYDALVWTLNCITVCVRHRQRLETLCPQCGKWSALLTGKARAGYCFHCQAWLGSSVEARGDTDDGFSGALMDDVRAATVVGEMLALSPKFPALLARHRFSTLVSEHIAHCTKGNTSAFARFIEVDYLKVKQLKSGMNLPPLDVLVHILQRLGLSPSDFFSGSQAMVDLPDQRDIQPLPKKSKVVGFLQSALTDANRPSTGELAKRIGYKQEGQFRQTCPELCKAITARHKPARSPQSFYRPRLQTDRAIRDALSGALEENPVPSLQTVAERLGYKYAATLKGRCPDLYRSLMMRRRMHLRQKAEQTKRVLEAVLEEDPPPTLRTVRQRLGYTTDTTLKYQHPELCQAIIARHKDFVQAITMKIQPALEGALTEYPPPSVRQVARNVKRSIGKLYRLAPALCRKIAARRLEHLAHRAAQKRAALRCEIKRAVVELHAAGIYPSPARVTRILPASVAYLMRREDSLKLYGEALHELGIGG